PGTLLLARLFWVNWFLFLLNVVLIGFPLDGGRMFQAVLWRYVGYRQATLAAVFAGFVVMFIVALAAIIWNELLPLFLALFVFIPCKRVWMGREPGGEESLSGYDFSQGSTSPERDQGEAPRPRAKPRQSWWQRWAQRRAARRQQRQEETRLADEQRM